MKFVEEGRFSRHIAFDLAIGESPVWDDERKRLWFVDILAPAIYSLDPETSQLETYAMPMAVASVGLADRGRLIVALRNGVHLFDPVAQSLQFVVHPEPDKDFNRLNDGKVGPDGCFWVGSMHDSVPRKPTGSLYRITPDGRSQRVVEGLGVSNGLAWSPDGKIMYHADTRVGVSAYDFDLSSGQVQNGRMIRKAEEKIGLPDGGAVDVEGFYWSAGVTAGRMNKISPQGEIVDWFMLPIPAPTMPCFGGPDLKTMFITSLATERTGTLIGGTLISCRLDVAGVPVGKFTPNKLLPA